MTAADLGDSTLRTFTLWMCLVLSRWRAEATVSCVEESFDQHQSRLMPAQLRQSSIAEAADFRAAGNAAFKAGRLQDALKLYSAALAAAPCDSVAYSNRAAVYLRQGQLHASAEDAISCIKLAPAWPKGYFRLGAACMAMGDLQCALAVLQTAQHLASPPADEEVSQLLAKCQVQYAAMELAGRVQRQLLSADMQAAVTHAQQAEQHAFLRQQLSQSMAAPGDWEPEDWNWRPTWCAEMRLPLTLCKEVSPAACSATTGSHQPAQSSTEKAPSDAVTKFEAGVNEPFDGTQIKMPAVLDPEQQQVNQLIARYCKAAAELEAPQELLQLLSDELKLAAYSDAIRSPVGAAPGCHVLCLGPGAPVWALLAAAAGARKATAIVKNRLAYLAAQDLVQANAALPNIQAVHISPVPLRLCRLQQQQGVAQHGTAATTQEQASPSAAVASEPGVITDGDLHASQQTDEEQANTVHLHDLDEPASIVVCDADFSILGSGLIPDLQLAAHLGLVTADAVMLPSQIHVMGCLSEEAWLGFASGVDMSMVNAGRWYPGIKPVHLCGTQHKPLTAPTQLACLDLDAVLQSYLNRTADVQEHVQTSKAARQHNLVPSAQGAAAAAPPPTGSATEAHHTGRVSVMGTAAGVCNVVYIWAKACFPAVAGGTVYAANPQVSQQQQQQQHGQVQEMAHATCRTQADHAIDGSATGVCMPGRQAVGALYLDSFKITPGQQVVLQLVVEPYALHIQRAASGPSTPRSALLPSWHADVLHDTMRTAAYEQAIRLAIALQKEQSPSADITVLDVGSGCGLIAALAARLPEVSQVQCVEPSTSARSMAVCSPKVAVSPSIDRSSGHAPRLIVLEGLDAGLLGEGVLRSLAAANHVAHHSASCIPHAAKVFCQLICMAATAPSECSCPGWPGMPLSSGSLHTCVDNTQYEALDLQPTDATSITTVHASKSTSQGASNDGQTTWVVSPAGRWRPMSSTVSAGQFDFMQALRRPTPPGRHTLQVTACADGIINAVAFWYQLQMLPSDAPHCLTLGGGPLEQYNGHTSQRVAVQHLGASRLHVKASDQLEVLVSHDTYALQFTVTKRTAGPSVLPPDATTTSASGSGPPLLNESGGVTLSALEPTDPKERLQALEGVNTSVQHQKQTSQQVQATGQGTEETPNEVSPDRTCPPPNHSSGVVSACHDTVQTVHHNMAPAGTEQHDTLPAATQKSGLSAAWHASLHEVWALDDQLGKACGQDPLLYRRLANTALQVAARPQDHGNWVQAEGEGLPAAQCARLAARLCG